MLTRMRERGFVILDTTSALRNMHAWLSLWLNIYNGWTIRFLPGGGGAQISTKQNPVQGKLRKKYKASHEKITNNNLEQIEKKLGLQFEFRNPILTKYFLSVVKNRFQCLL